MLLVLAALLLAGCGRSPEATESAADTTQDHSQPMAKAPAPPKTAPAAAEQREDPNQVVIDNFVFKPATLTVKAGTKVTWVNRDDVPHTATSTAKPRRFNSGTLDTDDVFSHTFNQPGTYEYFCAVHPHMTGRIIVK
jgi:plastocyanin